jgi:hypothetical protein
LSKAITSLLADAKVRRSMGEAGYRRLNERFTSERMTDLYDELVPSSNP